MKKFLMFDLMITPWIIRILYWILQIVVIIGGLYTMFSGARVGYGMGGAMGGLVMILGGSLILRMYLELMIVLFKICENTSKLKELKEKELSLKDNN